MSQLQQLIKADLRNSTAVSTLNKANTIKTQAHGLPKDQEATSESYAPVQNVVTPGFVHPALQPTTPAPCSEKHSPGTRDIEKSVCLTRCKYKLKTHEVPLWVRKFESAQRMHALSLSLSHTHTHTPDQ